MATVDFTSFDDVRAALGVEKDELTDATLSLDLYAFNLVAELEAISLTLIGDYEAQKETSPADLTDKQKRFHRSLRVFSAYAVANQACTGLPMFAPKDETDGKAGKGRFAQDPYKATIARIAQQYEAAKVTLTDAYIAVQPATPVVNSSRPYLSISTPDYDPVIGPQ
jgi:hypothetical protein